MSEHEKIETAGRKKDEGNLLFKSGKYQRAGKKYDKVTSCLISLKFCFFDSHYLQILIIFNAMFCKLVLLLFFCHQAADYVSEVGNFADEDQRMVKALQVSCWLNGAACCLKLDDFHGAIRLCSKVKKEGGRRRHL